MEEAGRLPRNDNLDIKGSLQYDRQPIRFTLTRGLDAYEDFTQASVSLAGLDIPKGGGSYMVAVESVELVGHRITGVRDTTSLVDLNISRTGMVSENAGSGFFNLLIETDGLCEAPRTEGGTTKNITSHMCSGTYISYDPALRITASGSENILIKTVRVDNANLTTSSINPVLSSDSSFLNFSFRMPTAPGYNASFGESALGLNDVPDSVLDNMRMNVTFLLYPNPYYNQKY